MKIRALFVSLSLFSLLSLSACNQDGAAPAGSGAEKHAAEGVKPGSHEDWCGEHEVPESQCTKCNPSLAAAFKASNDWCVEHDLPESHCRKCNPNLKIERPAKGQ